MKHECANGVARPLETLRAQQLECAQYIIDGGPDQCGAILGLFDAFAEEFILTEEARHETRP